MQTQTVAHEKSKHKDENMQQSQTNLLFNPQVKAISCVLFLSNLIAMTICHNLVKKSNCFIVFFVVFFFTVLFNDGGKKPSVVFFFLFLLKFTRQDSCNMSPRNCKALRPEHFPVSENIIRSAQLLTINQKY